MTDQELKVQEKQEVTKGEPTRAGRAYQPTVDIHETPEALTVWADLPGVDEKDVQVDLVDGVLTIQGPVTIDEYKDLTAVYTEYRLGNYVRRFTVSSDVDPSRIEARFKHGVLELKLPKAEKAKPRKIQVLAA